MSEKAVLFLILALFILISSLGFTRLPAPYGDNARYIILARSFLEGKAMRLINFPDEPFEAKIQPLYPLFLASLIGIFGYHILVLKISSLVFMVSALVFFYLVIARLKIPRFVRFVVLALLAANTLFLEYSRVVLSEACFIFLLSLAMFFITVYEEEGRARFLLAGLFTATAMAFVRDVSIIAILIIAGMLLGKKQHRASCGVFLLAAVVGALWWYKNMHVQSGYLTEFVKAGNYLEPSPQSIGIGPFIRRYVYEAAAYIGDVLPDVVAPLFKGIAPHSRFWLLKVTFGLGCFGMAGYGFVKLRMQTKARFLLIFPLCYVISLPFFGTYGVRYLFPVWFFIALFLAYGLSCLPLSKKQGIIIGLAAALIACHGIEERKNIASIRQGFPGAVANYYKALGFLRDNALAGKDGVIICRSPFLGFLLSGHKTVGYPYTSDTKRMHAFIKSSEGRFLIVDSLTVAGIGFSRKYLVPAVEEYKDSFRLVYADRDPPTEVYEVIR